LHYLSEAVESLNIYTAKAYFWQAGFGLIDKLRMLSDIG
jgi:hypothetical protein